MADKVAVLDKCGATGIYGRNDAGVTSYVVINDNTMSDHEGNKLLFNDIGSLVFEGLHSAFEADDGHGGRFSRDVIVYETANGKKVNEIRNSSDAVLLAIFAGDNHIITSHDSLKTLIWQAAPSKPLFPQTITMHTHIYSISRDRKYFTTPGVDDKTINVYDLEHYPIIMHRSRMRRSSSCIHRA